MIDFNRYDHRTFHEDEETDKKIKALFLLFDYEVVSKKLSFDDQLTLIEDWIDGFEEHELYEVIPMFKIRRDVIAKQILREEYENMSFREYLALTLKNIKLKLKKLTKRLFNRKN